MTTAIFPMRGQPPHIGHVLSIVKIYNDYDKIILHVVSGPGKHFKKDDFIIPPDEVVATFKEIFKHMPKIEVILGKEHLRDRTSFDDLPPFDVIITGSRDFIKNMKSRKPVRYIKRSKIYGFDMNGTMLRKMMRKDL